MHQQCDGKKDNVFKTIMKLLHTFLSLVNLDHAAVYVHRLGASANKGLP